MAVKNIVFDLGNVLIPFDYQPMIEGLNSIEGGLGLRFSDFYKANYRHHRDYESGQLTDDEFLSIMMNATEHKIGKEEFCKLFSNIFTVNENVTALLPKLKTRYRVYLLSNTNAIHQKYGWAHYPFIREFEKLFLSYEMGAVKPEPEIYQAVSRYTHSLPEEHIFIDDVAEYAEGARAQGWDAIQFVGYGNLVEELSRRGIVWE